MGEGEEGADLAVVELAEAVVDGFEGDVAAAEGGGGDGVEEPCEEASAVETWAGDEVAEDFGLDGEADGEGGVGDDLAWTADAVDDYWVAGVTFEVVIEVGGAGAGVAASDHVEEAAFGAKDGESAAVLGEEHGQLLG